MTKRHITIATRQSLLAIRQAETIKALLLAKYPHLSIDLLGITTQADRILNVTLTEIGGKGLFVKELEEALLDGRADIAVHSMKDVPMELPEKLCIPTVTVREEPRDVFVSNHYQLLTDLPNGASIGTSSLRRQTQLRAQRPDLCFQDLRGNINTRLNKLDQCEMDAIILAAAGLIRLNLESRIKSFLSIEQSLPAAGQGALAIECREYDDEIIELIKPFNDQATSDCVNAERALSRELNGGCKVPIAAYAKIQQGKLLLHGLVANRDGTIILRTCNEGMPADAEEIGLNAAENLLQQGAEKILKEFL